MPINKLFGGVGLMGRSLDLRYDRQGLIQSNIANIDTPGYKVKDFSFAGVMERVMTNKGDLTKTHPKHFSVDPVETSMRNEFTSEERPVDLDEEMLKLSENQLMYEVTTRILAKKFEGLKLAITEGGQ